MSIESITSIGQIDNIELNISTIEKQSPANKIDFSNYINNYITDVNQMINTADVKLRELAIGESTSIHEVLMSIEKAKTAMELGLQVRNRLLEAYQEVMRMQV